LEQLRSIARIPDNRIICQLSNVGRIVVEQIKNSQVEICSPRRECAANRSRKKEHDDDHDQGEKRQRAGRGRKAALEDV
jgi:hypothetical protein